jgi:hypothetical protein
MVALFASCAAGIYLGLYFNVFILLPILLIEFTAFTLGPSYGPHDNLGLVLLVFVSTQAGYMIGLTGRDAYRQVVARLGSSQSTGI